MYVLSYKHTHTHTHTQKAALAKAGNISEHAIAVSSAARDAHPRLCEFPVELLEMRLRMLFRYATVADSIMDLLLPVEQTQTHTQSLSHTHADTHTRARDTADPFVFVRAMRNVLVVSQRREMMIVCCLNRTACSSTRPRALTLDRRRARESQVGER